VKFFEKELKIIEEEFALGETFRTINRFTATRLHYLNALKHIIKIKDYETTNLQKETILSLEKIIYKRITDDYQVVPVKKSTALYKGLSYSAFEIVGKNYCGTCFLVDHKDNNYYYITNAHVVKNNPSLKIISNDRLLELDGEVVKMGNLYDIALVRSKAPTNPYIYLPVAFGNLEELKEGMKISILGNRSGLGLGIITGHVGSLKGNKLLLDAVTQHGTSGAPVFDEYGFLIGLNCGDTKEIPYALHGKIIKSFIKPLGLKIREYNQIKY